MSQPDLSDFSLLDLFRLETETQALVLTAGLLALERDPTLADHLEICMRAAHSLKGAAQIVGVTVAVRVAHAMEDCFVAAQRGQVTLRQAHIDQLLAATDLLSRIAHTAEAEIGQWDGERQPEVAARLASLSSLLTGEPATENAVAGEAPAPVTVAAEPPAAEEAAHVRARAAHRTACCGSRPRT